MDRFSTEKKVFAILAVALFAFASLALLLPADSSLADKTSDEGIVIDSTTDSFSRDGFEYDKEQKIITMTDFSFMTNGQIGVDNRRSALSIDLAEKVFIFCKGTNTIKLAYTASSEAMTYSIINCTGELEINGNNEEQGNTNSSLMLIDEGAFRSTNTSMKYGILCNEKLTLTRINLGIEIAGAVIVQHVEAWAVHSKNIHSIESKIDITIGTFESDTQTSKSNGFFITGSSGNNFTECEINIKVINGEKQTSYGFFNSGTGGTSHFSLGEGTSYAFMPQNRLGDSHYYNESLPINNAFIPEPRTCILCYDVNNVEHDLIESGATKIDKDLYFSVFINREPVKSTIQVQIPAKYHSGMMAIEGKVSDNTVGLVLSLGGRYYDVDIAQDHTFTHIVQLTEGDNAIRMIITSQEVTTNYDYKVRYVVVAPQSTLDPSIPKSVDTNTVEIKGLTNDCNNTIRMTVNGNTVTDVAVSWDGSFSKDISLQKGKNTIVVTTENTKSETNEVTIQIDCTARQPSDDATTVLIIAIVLVIFILAIVAIVIFLIRKKGAF